MNRFALPTILFIAIFQLCPPMFATGGTFDVTIKDGGEVIHGIYFDNVYNVLLYLLLSWLSISIPVVFKELKREYRWLSFLSGAWWIVGSAFEVANFAEPLEVYNTSEVRSTYGYYLFVFIIGLTMIILNKKWRKQEQQ